MTEPLDISALRAIQALTQPGRPNLVAEVVTVYLQYVPLLLDDLGNAASRCDCRDVARCAHTLKSSSSQLGAQRLAESCNVLEHAARSGLVESFSEMLTLIRREFETVRARLTDELRAARAL